MDEKQQQFIADLASLALLVVQAIFHGQALFGATPSSSPTFQTTHAAIRQVKSGLSSMTETAQQ